MKKTFLVVLVILVLLLTIPSRNAAAETPEQAKMIKTFVENAVQSFNIPGASLVVIKDGEPFVQGNWGVLGDGSPVTADSVFLIGSLSKPLTALAVFILMEEGKIRLDDPLDAHLPDFRYETGGGSPITVRDLLEHTSGIGEYDSLDVTDRPYEGQDPIRQAVGRLSGVRLIHEPGKTYEYNSANYLLLGAIVEKVADQPFAVFVHERIFAPLGMHRSAADCEKAVEIGLEPGFRSWFGKPVKSGGFCDRAGAPYGYIASSAGDMAKFLAFMIHGGELLSDETRRLLTAPPRDGRRYGFGWHFARPDDAAPFFYHGGATPDFRAEMFFLPERKIGAVLLTNKYHALEDGQISLIMMGIRTILQKSALPDLPETHSAVPWMFLGIALGIALFSGICLAAIARKPVVNQALWFLHGALALIVSAGLIPALSFAMGTPWRSVALFAPDVAFLATVIAVMLAAHALLVIGLAGRKKRRPAEPFRSPKKCFRLRASGGIAPNETAKPEGAGFPAPSGFCIIGTS